MKCPYHSEIGCSKFDLLPCVGLDNCAYMNGSSNLLQGIQTPYAELQARAEKAEGELLSLKEKLGVGDCDYCNENKETTIAMIKKEAEELSKKLVKENQELGIKLAKAESELKAIKDRIEAIKKLPTIENGQFVAECRWNAGYNTAIYDCKEIIKQIGGVK